MSQEDRGPARSPRLQKRLDDMLDDGDFYIDRIPESESDWLLDRQLLMSAWWEDQQHRMIWVGGKEPQTDAERANEIALRRERSEQQLATARAQQEAQFQAAVLVELAQATRVRSYVVLGIVAALIVMPVLGMLTEVAPEDFSQFVAPVAGIAGTVIGYWFGSREQGASEQSQAAVTPASARDLVGPATSADGSTGEGP